MLTRCTHASNVAELGRSGWRVEPSVLTPPILRRGGELHDPAMAPWQCVQHQRRHAADVARRQLPGGAPESCSACRPCTLSCHSFVAISETACGCMVQQVAWQGMAEMDADGFNTLTFCSALQMPYFGYYPVPSIVELSPASLPRFGDASCVVYAFFGDGFAGIPPELVCSPRCSMSCANAPKLHSVPLYSLSTAPFSDPSVSQGGDKSAFKVCVRMHAGKVPAPLRQVAALEPRLRLVAPGVNGSRTVLAASWTADTAGWQAVLPGSGQLAAGQYIVQVSRIARIILWLVVRLLKVDVSRPTPVHAIDAAAGGWLLGKGAMCQRQCMQQT